MSKNNKIKSFIFTYKYYFLILLFSFALGGVFHKKQIFPYGFGFYQDFKDFKKYGFNYKKNINQIAEISNKLSPRLVFYEKLTSDSCRDLVILNSGKFFVTGISDMRAKDFTFRFISRRR